ncbi:MAG: HEAT repeat domain-containing protein [Planctomycetota bacterium]|nr:HEAT repeat domain-containing protein [Planctomycetota bacterium]
MLRVLRRIGTEQSVAPLAELLTDEKLAHNARFALQRLPTPEATTALRRALGRSEGKLRIGIVSSLADRGDPSVVPELTPFIAANDAALSEAAIRALARIGGQEAARALAASELPVERQRSRDNALLVCAEKLLREGQKENALSVFRKLASDRSRDALIRLGAHRGIFLAEREKAVPAILPLLDAEDRALRQGAIQLLTTVPGEAVSRALAEALPRQKPERQVTIIEALVQRGDREVYPAVAEIAKSSDRRARIAALRALGTLGDARSVGLLAARLRADGEEGKVAFESLTSLRGEGVVPATLQLVRRADEPTRLKAIDALVARNETGAVPALLEAARDAESSVRAAAFRALGSLAGPAELEQLTGLLVERRDATDRQRVAQAIRSVAGRVDEKDAASRVIVTALGEANGPAEVLLLGVLPVLSTEDGIDAARSKIRSADRAVARAAVESLASWRNPAALPDLLDLARKGAPEHRAIALRGYIRLLSLPADRPSLATVKLLGEALELTGDVEDRRRILAQTAEFPCKEALALAEAHSGDEAVGETARKAAEKIRGILISNSLVARASHGSGEAKNAFDGDPRTRWTTGTPMRPGMWFTVDLGAERSVTRLILDSRDSPGDYPRGCEVHVSFDGKNWGKPVLTSPPQRPITRLVFPKPVRARFIKIVQTGETQGLWWSIHEMRIAFE